MATFSRWLESQVSREDDVGLLAQKWKLAEGNRPKVHAPAGVIRWLESLEDIEETRPWYEAALGEYQAGRTSLRVLPGGNQPDAGQVLDALSEIRLRLSTIEVNMQAIGAHLGVDWIEPAPAAEVLGIPQPWAELLSWPKLAEIADWPAAASGEEA